MAVARKAEKTEQFSYSFWCWPVLHRFNFVSFAAHSLSRYAVSKVTWHLRNWHLCCFNLSLVLVTCCKSCSDSFAMQTQCCVASSLMKVGTSSKPPGRGCAKGDAKRWHNGFCTPVMQILVRNLAGMKLWLATWATPLTDMCLKQASWRVGSRAEGTVSKLLRTLPTFTTTSIPIRAGTCHFLFLVAGSLEPLSTNTGTVCNVCPNNSSSIKITPLYGISSPFAAFSVTWVKGQCVADFPAPTYQSL